MLIRKTIEWQETETKLSDLKAFEVKLLKRAIEIAREAKEREITHSDVSWPTRRGIS